MINPDNQKEFIDGFSVVDGGVDTGKAPILLKQNQLSYGVNIDLRGGFIRPRAGLRKVELTFGGNDVLELRQKTGRWQVGWYFKPDNGPAVLLASIGGRQFRFNVATDRSVQEITISYQTTTTVDFIVPPETFNVNITVVDASKLSIGAIVLINGKNYTVEAIVGLLVTVKNIDDDGTINPVVTGATVISYDPNPSTREQAWGIQAEMFAILQDGQSLPWIYDGSSARRAASNLPVPQKEIGPGRMMDYVMGRIWYALPDERSFRATDLVGGTSGTAQYNKRDSILKETENTYLNGGGDFTTPNSSGPIRGIKGVATLDSSLGQGPVQILTPNTTFSVNSPLDRTTWQNLENPIQTISLISNGALSHYGSILVNGDLIYRSLEGIRSLILARREFNGWGNTPMSREMNRVLNLDDQSLLKFSNAVVFNNRLLMTTSPFRTSHGVIHRALVALDFDLSSSMGQKSQAVYEGILTGLNVLQIVQGEFEGVERCFIFTLNHEQEIELYELSKDLKFDRQTQYGDDIPISMIFETASFRFNSALPPDEPKILKKLNSMEIEIANLQGNVHFKAYYRPDNYPCWIPWREWDECATYKDCSMDPLTGCMSLNNFKPQFRPRMTLGEPDNACDPITNRPLRHGYSFQVRMEISGQCEVRSLTLKSEKKMEPPFAPDIRGCS